MNDAIEIIQEELNGLFSDGYHNLDKEETNEALDYAISCIKIVEGLDMDSAGEGYFILANDYEQLKKG